MGMDVVLLALSKQAIVVQEHLLFVQQSVGTESLQTLQRLAMTGTA